MKKCQLSFDYTKVNEHKTNYKIIRSVGICAVIAILVVTLWSVKTRGLLDDFERSFYPGISAVVHSEGNDNWQTIGEFTRNDTSSEVTNYLEYNHLTARHIVTCQANLAHDIEIRVLDMSGNILTESMILTSDDIANGKDLSLADVNNNEKYLIQYKYPYEADFVLNFA